jgi:hypothetical protein
MKQTFLKPSKLPMKNKTQRLSLIPAIFIGIHVIMELSLAHYKVSFKDIFLRFKEKTILWKTT